MELLSASSGGEKVKIIDKRYYFKILYEGGAGCGGKSYVAS